MNKIQLCSDEVLEGVAWVTERNGNRDVNGWAYCWGEGDGGGKSSGCSDGDGWGYGNGYGDGADNGYGIG